MAIRIRCKRGSGVNQGPDISSPLISTQAMAEARGKRYLDDPALGGYYPTKTYEEKVPHKRFFKKGDIVTFSASKLDISNKKMRVSSYKLSGNDREMWGTITGTIMEDIT